MIYWQLFWSMAQIGILSFGGGYVAVPLIQHEIVEARGWISATEFTDLITIAEMTPGPIAINAATFVGIRVAGIPGALVSTFGCVLPSCLIVLLLAKIYYKYQNLDAMGRVLSGLRPAVVGMIASAGLSILLLSFFSGGALQNVNLVSVLIFGAGMFALRKGKLNPLYVMGGAGALGYVAYALLGIQ